MFIYEKKKKKKKKLKTKPNKSKTEKRKIHSMVQCHYQNDAIL